MHAAIATVHCRPVSGCDVIDKTETDQMRETEANGNRVNFNEGALDEPVAAGHSLTMAKPVAGYSSPVTANREDLSNSAVQHDTSSQLSSSTLSPAAEDNTSQSKTTHCLVAVSAPSDEQIRNECGNGSTDLSRSQSASVSALQQVAALSADAKSGTVGADYKVAVSPRDVVVLMATSQPMSANTATAAMTTDSSRRAGGPVSSGGVVGFDASPVFPFDAVGGRLASANGSPAAFVYYTTAADVQRLCSSNATGSVPIVISAAPFHGESHAGSGTSWGVGRTAISEGGAASTSAASVKLATNARNGEVKRSTMTSSFDKTLVHASSPLAIVTNGGSQMIGMDSFTIKTEPVNYFACEDPASKYPVSLIASGETGRADGASRTASVDCFVDSTTTPRTTSPAKPETAAVVGSIPIGDVLVGLAVRGSTGSAGQVGGAAAAAANGKTFSCPICMREFASEKYLSMHVSLHQQQLQQQAGTLSVASTFELPVTPASTATTSVAGVCVDTMTAGEIHGLHAMTNSSSQLSIPPSGLAFTTSPSVATTILSIASGAAVKQLPPPPPPIRRPKTGSGSKVGGGHWTCQICEKTFAQNSNYKNHIRTHSNERPFVCEICSIGFKERYHLKKHVLFKHTDELREECRVCGKRFKDSTAVRAHERTHSDQRPYACPRCDKTFKTSECLWHHENRSKTCGKSLGDLPATGGAATKQSLQPAADTGEVGGRGDGSGRNRRGRMPSVSGARRNKQTTTAAAASRMPLAFTMASVSCPPPTVISFPIEEEQMVYTEVVVSEEQRQQHMKEHDVHDIRQMVVSSGAGSTLR